MVFLKIVAALATVATGLFSLIAPLKVREFTGLEISGGRGVSEVRAILGGFFVALGSAPIIFSSTEMFFMLGFAYLVVAVVRGISMFADRSVVRSNLISLVVELLLGVILVL